MRSRIPARHLGPPPPFPALGAAPRGFVPAAPAAPAPGAARAERYAFETPLSLAGLLLAHAVLGVAMSEWQPLALAHALLVLGVGLWAAVRKDFVRVVMVLAYVSGAEVLWRMTKGAPVWEFGKYAVCLVVLVSLVRLGRQGRVRLLPIAYFVLLIPSAFLTLAALGAEGRTDISFNLSGPLALMFSVWLLSQLQLDERMLRRVFVALVAPVASISAVTLYGIVTAQRIRFTGESNAALSGGFGANQVSSALGLGGFIAFLLLFQRGRGRGSVMVLGVAFVAFVVQSALTFSRGGVYVMGGAMVTAVFFLLRERRARITLLVFAALTIPVMNAVILPRINDFTKGTLAERFQDTDLTRRDDIARYHVRLWMENPFGGVGPGMGNFLTNGQRLPSHTEFTRLVAEHGMFGFLAMLVLVVIAGRAVLSARTPLARAAAASLIAWSLLFMVQSGMRIVAPSLLFGLGTLRLVSSTPSPAPSPAPRRRGWTP